MANNDSELHIFFDDDGGTPRDPNQSSKPSTDKPSPSESTGQGRQEPIEVNLDEILKGIDASLFDPNVKKQVTDLLKEAQAQGQNNEAITDALRAATERLAEKPASPPSSSENTTGGPALPEGNGPTQDIVNELRRIADTFQTPPDDKSAELLESIRAEVEALRTQQAAAPPPTNFVFPDIVDLTQQIEELTQAVQSSAQLTAAQMNAAVNQTYVDLKPVVDELKLVTDAIEDLQNLYAQFDVDPIVDELENLALLIDAQTQTQRAARQPNNGSNAANRTVRGAVGSVAAGFGRKVAGEATEKVVGAAAGLAGRAAGAAGGGAASAALGTLAGTLALPGIGTAIGAAVGTIAGGLIGDAANGVISAIHGMQEDIVNELREVNGEIAAANAVEEFRRLEAAIERGNDYGQSIAATQPVYTDLNLAMREGWMEFYMILRPFLVIGIETLTGLLKLLTVVLFLIRILVDLIVWVISKAVGATGLLMIPVIGNYIKEILDRIRGVEENHGEMLEGQIASIFEAVRQTGDSPTGGYSPKKRRR